MVRFCLLHPVTAAYDSCLLLVHCDSGSVVELAAERIVALGEVEEALTYGWPQVRQTHAHAHMRIHIR